VSGLLLLQALSTLALTGLIWFVQVVHYPLLGRVGRSEHRAYHAAHVRRTGWVVAPLMLAEAGTALALALRPGGLPPGAAWAGLGLVGFLWASTFLVQVPCHERLARGFDEAAWQRLVRTNWLRTGAWTVRAGLVVWLLSMGGAPA